MDGPSRDLEGQAILVAEDDYVVARALVSELSRHGASIVGPVSSMTDATRHVASTELHGAILDIRLHDEVAFPVADQLADRGVPFVFATGYSRTSLPQHHEQRFFYPKPYVPSDVVRALRGSRLAGGKPTSRRSLSARSALWNLRVSAAERHLQASERRGEATSATRDLVARMKREPGNLRLTVQRALLRNRLLAGLPDEAFRIIEADLEPVLLERGRELPAGDGIHFVESGVLSAFVRVPGGIDSAPVGREGAAGLGALIRGESPRFRYVVQNGGDALRIPASDLSAAILRRPDIAEHLTHHVIARMAEIAANAQAHVRLSVRQRLGRYLLAHRDRVDAPEIDLTHGILAEILGVRRASVTDAMHHLEGTGAIRNIRGRIIVHDADLLDRLCGLDAASPSRR